MRVGGHYGLDGHEFEQPPGIGVGPGGLVCCSPQGCKKLDMTERLHFDFSLSCIGEGGVEGGNRE